MEKLCNAPLASSSILIYVAVSLPPPQPFERGPLVGAAEQLSMLKKVECGMSAQTLWPRIDDHTACLRSSQFV
jgi:hypothetical protein